MTEGKYSVTAFNSNQKEKPIMKQYLLLMPIKAADFSINNSELIEAAAEWGATIVKSKNMQGNTSRFLVTQTLQAMESLCSNCDLEGTVVEITGIYDQEIEEDN